MNLLIFLLFMATWFLIGLIAWSIGKDHRELRAFIDGDNFVLISRHEKQLIDTAIKLALKKLDDEESRLAEESGGIYIVSLEEVRSTIENEVN
jgi:hypothetical protein